MSFNETFRINEPFTIRTGSGASCLECMTSLVDMTTKMPAFGPRVWLLMGDVKTIEMLLNCVPLLAIFSNIFFVFFEVAVAHA